MRFKSVTAVRFWDQLSDIATVSELLLDESALDRRRWWSDRDRRMAKTF
jgi:hypothetical protein